MKDRTARVGLIMCGVLGTALVAFVCGGLTSGYWDVETLSPYLLVVGCGGVSLSIGRFALAGKCLILGPIVIAVVTFGLSPSVVVFLEVSNETSQPCTVVLIDQGRSTAETVSIGANDVYVARIWAGDSAEGFVRSRYRVYVAMPGSNKGSCMAVPKPVGRTTRVAIRRGEGGDIVVCPIAER